MKSEKHYKIFFLQLKEPNKPMDTNADKHNNHPKLTLSPQQNSRIKRQHIQKRKQGWVLQ
jgi:hypothetical protein